MKKLNIGTRGSELALAQANEVRARLEVAHGDKVAAEIHVISTKGDRVLDRPLSEIGGKGLFTFEIEERLSDGRIDLAVHSSKDMPTMLPKGLELSCFLERESAADAFLSSNAETLEALPENAVVGSSSLRRGALIKRLRPDISVVNFRGNVQTRLKKLEAGDVHATLLAEAGLNRLGLADLITAPLDLKTFPPAPGQGAICIESRVGDAETLDLLKPLSHEPTKIALLAERAFLAALDGSCRTPLAGHATIEKDLLHFHGMILSPDGTKCYEKTTHGALSDATNIGTEVAQFLRAEAGSSFFEDWNQS